jgi:hypothetical protein
MRSHDYISQVPRAAEHLAFALVLASCAQPGVTISARCGDTRPVHEIDVRDRSRWHAIEAGVDRVYVEEGASLDVANAATELASQRAALRSVSRIEPPAVALAFARDDHPNHLARPDEAQRPVWVTAPNAPFQWTLAHEQTHAVLHEARGKSDGPRDERFVEDGFCELVAWTLADEDARRVRAREAAKAVRTRLARGVRVIDLLGAAPGYDASQSFEEQCKDPPYWLYAVAFAYWLDRLERAPDTAARVFAALTAAPRRPLTDVATAISPALDARRVPLEDALAILERR